MAKKKPTTTAKKARKPDPLTPLERKQLSRILAKARAFQAYYKNPSNPTGSRPNKSR